MKKLYYYFYFILFFSTNALAQQISLSDIKIGSKLTNYFTSNEISKYYQDDMEKNAKGEKVWSKDLKYSAVAFYGNEIGDDHDFIQIYYEIENGKLVRKFPVFENGEASDYQQIITYTFKPGEAMLQFKIDSERFVNKSKVKFLSINNLLMRELTK